MGKALNLKDKKYGKLTVLYKIENKWELTQWKCQCNCPKKTIIDVTTKDLRSGRIKDCGCNKKEKKRKIKSKFNIFNNWR